MLILHCLHCKPFTSVEDVDSSEKLLPASTEDHEALNQKLKSEALPKNINPQQILSNHQRHFSRLKTS
ncbi:hypothetical protein ILYODFUR_020961 [Ilyodon furcidens]|uniref:Uncharacterized protein n=1 Tax=Ilyodon furcidens TaxID=33524 RepID=A0ABV0SPQ5_9TELE